MKIDIENNTLFTLGSNNNLYFNSSFTELRNKFAKKGTVIFCSNISAGETSLAVGNILFKTYPSTNTKRTYVINSNANRKNNHTPLKKSFII